MEKILDMKVCYHFHLIDLHSDKDRNAQSIGFEFNLVQFDYNW